MPWGTSEGGIPQPYQIKVLSAHWEKARKRDGELVTTRAGENLMNLVFEGEAHRLIEQEDGSYSVGEIIEPLDGEHNRRSFLIGNTSQWVDPRENGEKIESTRGAGEMPWARSELGRLIASLVELIGTDELETWGPWEEASSWAGRTYQLVPTHDTDADGNPVTYTTGDGQERIDWYFQCVGVEKAGGGRKKARSRKSGSSGLEGKLKKAYDDFDGSEDEFVDYIQTDDFALSGELAKLSDDDFDALIDKVVG
ncbi:MAG: hypothetical protein ACE5F5_11810 [Acidimicrobiia bacterium]